MGMLIPVIYFDHSHDTIESYTLTHLIREGKIRSFKRASGWVHIGKDRIRKHDYAGLKRSMKTHKHENNLLHMQEDYM
jgi:hypothetical protein